MLYFKWHLPVVEKKWKDERGTCNLRSEECCAYSREAYSCGEMTQHQVGGSLLYLPNLSNLTQAVTGADFRRNSTVHDQKRAKRDRQLMLIRCFRGSD